MANKKGCGKMPQPLYYKAAASPVKGRTYRRNGQNIAF